ncbi:LOW QUALITY PROTEIN: uncharacterized protein LOC144720615 [Lampetra planeri]
MASQKARKTERFLQLAPQCVAMVLSRERASAAQPQGSGSSPDPGAEPRRSGYAELFAEFKAENTARFWDGRLSERLRGLYLLGWLHGGVLLLRGEPAELGALRDAWSRRALRPPRGYTIDYLGEVGPILMSPDSQSQFIPLSDVLCAAISHLNSKQQAVTQDSLLKHLAHKFPGVPVPSREILHNMLSSLIKERKIYHTGEGYFIVTPQTYYITPSLIRDENKWVRPEGDNQATPFPEVTVCHDLPEKDAQPSRAHCRSCQCFLESGYVVERSRCDKQEGGHAHDPKDAKPPQLLRVVSANSGKSKKNDKSAAHANKDSKQQHSAAVNHAESGRKVDGRSALEKDPKVSHQSVHVTFCNDKGKKLEKGVQNDCKDVKGVPVAVVAVPCTEKMKLPEVTVGRPEKEKDGEKLMKKISLRLFRRSSQRKEKVLQKELVTFSAQFPPEEWPVRDEDSAENLPRDVEHQIIRRINPDLTVQNLMVHTALMQRVPTDGQQAMRSTGTCTELPQSRSRVKVRSHSKRVHTSSRAYSKGGHLPRRRLKASSRSSLDEANQQNGKRATRRRHSQAPGEKATLRNGNNEGPSEAWQAVEEVKQTAAACQHEEFAGVNQGDLRTFDAKEQLERSDPSKVIGSEQNVITWPKNANACQPERLKFRWRAVEHTKSTGSSSTDPHSPQVPSEQASLHRRGRHREQDSDLFKSVSRMPTILSPRLEPARVRTEDQALTQNPRLSDPVYMQEFGQPQQPAGQELMRAGRAHCRVTSDRHTLDGSCDSANGAFHSQSVSLSAFPQSRDCPYGDHPRGMSTADYFNYNESRETVLCAPAAASGRAFADCNSNRLKHEKPERECGKQRRQPEKLPAQNPHSSGALDRAKAEFEVPLPKSDVCAGKSARPEQRERAKQQDAHFLTQDLRSMSESEGMTDDDYLLYTQEVPDDSEGSSLCINDEDEDDGDLSRLSIPPFSCGPASEQFPPLDNSVNGANGVPPDAYAHSMQYGLFRYNYNQKNQRSSSEEAWNGNSKGSTQTLEVGIDSIDPQQRPGSGSKGGAGTSKQRLLEDSSLSADWDNNEKGNWKQIQQQQQHQQHQQGSIPYSHAVDESTTMLEDGTGAVEGSIFDYSPGSEGDSCGEAAHDEEISGIFAWRGVGGAGVAVVAAAAGGGVRDPERGLPHKFARGVDSALEEEAAEAELQQRFEGALTIASPDPSVTSTADSGVPPSRLDHTDMSSVTGDSGFNSPRTRESLASNTSSLADGVKRHGQLGLSDGRNGVTLAEQQQHKTARLQPTNPMQHSSALPPAARTSHFSGLVATNAKFGCGQALQNVPGDMSHSDCASLPRHTPGKTSADEMHAAQKIKQNVRGPPVTQQGRHPPFPVSSSETDRSNSFSSLAAAEASRSVQFAEVARSGADRCTYSAAYKGQAPFGDKDADGESRDRPLFPLTPAINV